MKLYSQETVNMQTRGQIRNVLTIAIVAVGILVLAVGPASAASITIVNGDFEAPVYDEDGAGGSPDWHWVPNWEEVGATYYGSGAGGYLYIGAGGKVDQDLNYYWSASETFTLSLVRKTRAFIGR